MQNTASNSNGLLKRYYLITFFTNLEFSLPVWVIFGHDYLHLSYLAGIALISVPELIGAALTVPMGALADRWSRHNIYRLGLFLLIIGLLPLAFSKNLYLLFAMVPLRGIGWAMSSGCLDSIVSTSLQEEGRDFREASTNNRTIFFSARSIGGIAGAAMYHWHPQTPFLAEIIALVICLAIAWRLPHVAKQHDDAKDIKAIRETVQIFLKHPGLKAVFVLMVLAEFLGNVTYITYQPKLIAGGFSPETFGLIFVPFSLFSIVGSRIAKHTMKTRSTAWFFRNFFAATAITSLGVAFTDRWLFLLFTIPLQIGFGTLFPVCSSYTAHRTPTHVRATALSLMGLTLGFWVIASLFTGAMLDKFGTTTIGLTAGVAAAIVALSTPRKSLSDHVAGTD